MRESERAAVGAVDAGGPKGAHCTAEVYVEDVRTEWIEQTVCGKKYK